MIQSTVLAIIQIVLLPLTIVGYVLLVADVLLLGSLRLSRPDPQ